MTPTQQTIEWLRKSLLEMPTEIKMVYVESGELVTPAPDNQTVARYDLFGFKSAPAGGFDPENEDHVADLGCWDWEAATNGRFPSLPLDACDWLEVLEAAVNHESIGKILEDRGLSLVFADHDGQVTVVR